MSLRLLGGKKISEKNCNIVNESIKNNLKLCQIAPNLNHKLFFLLNIKCHEIYIVNIFQIFNITF
jgi:hypothetical protein